MPDRSDILLAIDPFSYHFKRDSLFREAVRGYGDNKHAPWIYLRDWFASRGVRVHTADLLLEGEVSGKLNVYVSFGMRTRYRSITKRPDVIASGFFGFESPVVEPRLYSEFTKLKRYFRRLYSFSDAEALKPFLREPIEFHSFRIPAPVDRVQEEVWRQENRKFLVMIYANRLPAVFWHELYTERMRAAEFFARTGEIDLYGKGWNVVSFKPYKLRIPGTLQRMHRYLIHQWQRLRPDPLLLAARRIWKGAVDSKIECLGQYTFSICFENVILKGWVTEKIFDCFAAGNIPIYWGAPDIESYVPAQCFIDMRKFRDYAELRTFLKSLGPKEIQSYRDAGREYLSSPQFHPFTKEAFTAQLARVVEEDTGVKL